MATKIKKETLKQKYKRLDKAWKNGQKGLFDAVWFLKKIIERAQYDYVSQIKNKNADSGRYFFSKDNMRFFNSRIESEVIHGCFLIISNKDGYNKSTRHCRIVIALKNGAVEYLTDFHYTKSGAKKHLQQIIKKIGI